MSEVYEPFAGFEEWAPVAVDADRWAAVVSHVEELTSQETGFGWLEGPLRAAAYQSGAVEGLHPGDRGLTVTLMRAATEWEAAVRAAPDSGGAEVVDSIRDGVDALHQALEVATSSRPITQAWIRELHAVACRSQVTYMVTDSLGNRGGRPLPKGAYKEQPNNVRLSSGDLMVFAPPLDVPAEMERLVAQLGSAEFAAAHPLVQSAFAHHALTHIHPFPDGNGRVARALASVFILRAVSLPFFLFADEKSRYLDALASADEGDTGAFVAFVLGRVEDLSGILVEQRRAARPVTTGGVTVDKWRRQLDQLAGFVRAVDRAVDRAERRHEIFPPTTTDLFTGIGVAMSLKRTTPGGLPEVPPLRRDISMKFGGRGVTETVAVVMDDDTSHPFAVHAEPSGLSLAARPDEVWPVPTSALELRLDAWLDQVVGAMAGRLDQLLRGAC